MSIELPVVVRLDGTNAEEGRAILAEAALAERPRRADDARGGAEGGGALAMSRTSGRSDGMRVRRVGRAPAGRGPRPARGLGRGCADRARRRHRRRPRRATVAGSRARGRDDGRGAGDAAGRHLRGRAPAVRRRELRPRRMPHGGAPLRRCPRSGAGDGPCGARPRADRRHREHGRRDRGGGAPSRPLARAQLHRRRVARDRRRSGSGPRRCRLLRPFLRRRRVADPHRVRGRGGGARARACSGRGSPTAVSRSTRSRSTR